MTINFKALANPSVSQITPYKPGKPVEELERELGISSAIKLASNENPLGASPNAMAAAREMLKQAHIYPDGDGYELKKALSDALSVNMNQLTLGNGSENILELVCKTFLSPNVNAVISQYAFLTIPILIKSYGAILKVAKAIHYGHDCKQLLHAIDDKTRVIFLVNPNNPTGTYINREAFENFLDCVPRHIIIVIDEAYCEYITMDDYPNALHYLKHYPNMIISRTFSKAYGLAGLRIGFSVSSAELADLLNRARLPFNVNTIAARAATVALSDTKHMALTLANNQDGMQQLEQGLQALNLKYIPSIGNFITIDVGYGYEIYHALLKQGVIVRPLNAYDMPKHIRVTIGTPAEITRLLSSLTVLLPEIEHFKKEYS